MQGPDDLVKLMQGFYLFNLFVKEKKERKKN